MKKLFASIVITLFAFLYSSGQGCLPEGITFSTQEAIDDFQVNYPGCTRIGGSVHIKGNEITNLEGLNVITSIGGDLVIQDNPFLASLEGLANLDSVSGSVRIGPYYWSSQGNPILTDLSGLNNLVYIGDSLGIVGNVSLTSLTGLEGITTLSGNLSIVYNHSLPNITGLNNLVTVNGTLRLFGNDSLNSLTGLENLSSVGGDLEFGRYSQIMGQEYTCNPSLENMSGLDNLTYIGGSFTIPGHAMLTSFVGLESLTYIEGDLNIGSYCGSYGGGNPSLNSLSALGNLAHIGGGLHIGTNDVLTNLEGLEGIESLGGSLRVSANGSLNNLSGLDNLVSIDGDLIIGGWYMGAGELYSAGNPVLVNLEGLQSLVQIGGDLIVDNNGGMVNLEGLESLNTAGGYIQIGAANYYGGNQQLTSLAGLENVDPGTVTNLVIRHNPALSECHVQFVCEYLASPTGTIDVSGNAPGCNTMWEVMDQCDSSICLAPGYTFETQAQIDSFPINHPYCKESLGNVTIKGEGITNLSGLIGLESISGSLYIDDCDNLVNLQGLNGLESIYGSLFIKECDYLVTLEGLENLNYIGSSLSISKNGNLQNLTGLGGITTIPVALLVVYNPGLTSLAGIENLDSTGGSLKIFGNNNLANLAGLEGLTSVGGFLEVQLNPAMTNITGLQGLVSIGSTLIIRNNDGLASLAGLENLASIGGSLTIGYNGAMNSLTGLDNIDPASIDNIYVKYNDNLSGCNVQSICNYLAAPNGTVEIHDNAPGCNSIEEVEEACGINVGIDQYVLYDFTIHPNPADNGSITITLDNPRNLHLTCFNTFGQQVHQQEINSVETVINVSTWTPGMYLAVVYEDGKPAGKVKFIVN